MIFLLVTPLQIIYFLEFIGRFSPSKKSMYVCMYVCMNDKHSLICYFTQQQRT